jgi:hypothetical protein
MSAEQDAVIKLKIQQTLCCATAQEICDLLVDSIQDPSDGVNQARLRVEALVIALAVVVYRDGRVGKDQEFAELIAKGVSKHVKTMRRMNA